MTPSVQTAPIEAPDELPRPIEVRGAFVLKIGEGGYFARSDRKLVGTWSELRDAISDFMNRSPVSEVLLREK